MTESFKNKKAVFPAGRQRLLIEQAELCASITRIAHLCSVSERTIRDWRREKFPMDLGAVHILCKLTRQPAPSDVHIQDRYAHTKAAGAKGARAVMARYGRIPIDEKVRKERWLEWWKHEARAKTGFGKFATARPIREPKHSEGLAEFFGTMMGDGGIHTYQVQITLHHIDDLAYCRYVTQQIQTLFGVTPGIYHTPQKSVNNIVVSRRALVTYLHKEGLPIGNKVQQQFDIPEWIKRNKKYSVACVRGLVDTDGSVYTHRYRVNGKQYAYKKLSFCSRSRPLQLSVAQILASIGLRPRLSGFDVRLDSIDDMKKYFSLVGSHNPKHLNRYRK